MCRQFLSVEMVGREPGGEDKLIVLAAISLESIETGQEVFYLFKLALCFYKEKENHYNN